MLEDRTLFFRCWDRFAHQAKAQLRASRCCPTMASRLCRFGNKSNREHNFIGSEPSSVKAAAETAVSELGWNKPWHVDADHIRLETVDRFLEPSDSLRSTSQIASDNQPAMMM